MELIAQEVSTEREIDIPEPVREVFKPVAPEPAVPRPPAGEGCWARRPRSTTSTKA
jgi:hypothetical protein